MNEQVFSVGTRFKIVREKLNLSQQDIAAQANIARNTVSHLELDKDVKLSTLIDMSRALDVPPHFWLMADTDWLFWFMSKYGSKPYGWVRLWDLPPGFVFVTQEGVLAVKSEYAYGNGDNSQCKCILLGSGEYAHFANGNDTLVRAIEVTP